MEMKRIAQNPSAQRLLGRENGGVAAPLLAAAGMFAVISAVRVINGEAVDGIAVMYTLPVAFLALRFGLRGGLAGGTIATLLVLSDTSGDLDLSAIGFGTRISVLFLVGGLVGWFIDREHRSQILRRHDQAKLHRFFELSQDMLCTADSDGFFVDLNPAWERTLGLSPEELRAQPFVELVHPDDRERTGQEAAGIFEGDVTVDFDNRYLAKDGSVRWLRWSSVLGDDGMIYARATDVTAKLEAETALKDSAEELGRSNEDLRQFAYIASHDLNEPLRTIGGFAQLLQRRYEDQVDERGRDYISRMVGGVARMQTLISDLLKFSRAGREETEPESLDSSALAEQVVEDLHQAIIDRGAAVEVGSLPTLVANRNELQQIFQNLISNAIKFANGGTPRVELSAERIAAGWSFSVTDNGIGIDEHQRERIFGAFERLHTRDEYAGTGIGLAICKRIVEHRGGKIGVQPGLDGGSRFVFTVPDPAQARTA